MKKFLILILLFTGCSFVEEELSDTEKADKLIGGEWYEFFEPIEVDGITHYIENYVSTSEGLFVVVNAIYSVNPDETIDTSYAVYEGEYTIDELFTINDTLAYGTMTFSGTVMTDDAGPYYIWEPTDFNSQTEFVAGIQSYEGIYHDTIKYVDEFGDLQYQVEEFPVYGLAYFALTDWYNGDSFYYLPLFESLSKAKKSQVQKPARTYNSPQKLHIKKITPKVTNFRGAAFPFFLR